MNEYMLVYTVVKTCKTSTFLAPTLYFSSERSVFHVFSLDVGLDPLTVDGRRERTRAEGQDSSLTSDPPLPSPTGGTGRLTVVVR